ncbi:MAG TPA: hypothetical protein PK919_08675 [Candidatus Aminicenantes bacterium]|nr:hypothetical protein [Candidatus Aminicenantes bacterium]
MKKIAFFGVIFLSFLALVQAAESRETLTLPAGGLKALAIDCGAGYLKVRGQEGLESIEVAATLRVSGANEAELREFRKERVTLKIEKAGVNAVLAARIDDSFDLSKLFGGRDAVIDLDVRVPRRLDLDIEDGSGDAEIRDIDGRLDLEDGSGDARMADIRGDAVIEDGSGDLFLERMGGRVKIDDGSGDIELKDAGGAVAIEDGSGSIDLRGVAGPVSVDDGSGDIVIDGVEKDVTIEEAGSGGLEIRNVKGKVRK